MNAGLRLGRIEQVNGLSVFLLHGVVAGNGYLPECCICAEVIAKDGIVGGVGDERERSRSQKNRGDQPPQKTVDAGFQRGTHGVQL